MEKMTSPLIAIVVPVYKVEKYIGRCIESILKQTFRQFELILVDDGSPDNCGKICDSYVEQFKQNNIRCFVIHQSNGGLSAARNTGIEWVLHNSNSEWITFIDSDDWIHPQYLESLICSAQTYSTEIAVGRYDRRKEEYGEEQSIDLTQCLKAFDTEQFWVKSRTNATVAWGKLYKKYLFKNIQYPVGKYHEDEYVTYQILFQKEKIAVVDFPIYHYFVNEDSIMTMNYMKRLPDIKNAFQNHLDFFSDTKWKSVYRLEVEKYAESMSDAIWIYQKNPEIEMTDDIKDIRNDLIHFLKWNRKYIPLEKRKDIYIAAYPNRKYIIRIWGFIKGKIKISRREYE